MVKLHWFERKKGFELLFIRSDGIGVEPHKVSAQAYPTHYDQNGLQFQAMVTDRTSTVTQYGETMHEVRQWVEQTVARYGYVVADSLTTEMTNG